MGTNIEQIFRSFVVSKFKEIQEEKLNSDQAGSLLNGENVAPVMEASSSAIVVCDEGVLDEKTVEKTEEVLLEGLDVEPQKSDVKETPAESSSTVPEMNLVEEVPRKKSKKHKKHKSKKKKKKKKKEEKNRSHSKSKSNSSFQGQGEIDSESVPLQRGDSESLLKNLEDNKTNVVSLDTQSMADLENSKLSVQEQNLSVVTSVDGSKEAPFEVTQPEDECHTNINLMDINTTVEGLLLAPEPESDLIPAASVVSISKEEPEKSLEIAVKCEDECSIQASITDNGTADEKDSDKNQEVDINTLKRSRSRSASTSRKQPKLSSSHDTSNHSQSTRSGSRSGSLSDSKRSPSPSCRKSRSRSAEKGKNVEYSPKSRTKCSGSTSDKDKAKTHSRSHRSRSKSVARIKRSRSKTANRSKSRSLSHSRHEQRTRSRSKSKGRRSCSRERRRRSPSRERRKKSPSRERRKKSPSRERRKKSPSRERRKKSPSRERRKRSPSRERRRRSPSRERRRRSPLRERRRRSPSRERRKRSPSRERRKMSPSRERRRQSPSSERRKQSPRNSSSDKRRQRSNSKDCNSTGVKLRSRSRTPDYRQRSKSAGRRWSSCRSPGRQRKSRSPVKKKSFSRSPERRKRSRSPDKLKDLSRSPKRLTELDKAQLLEIAKANAAAMCVKAGVPLPESLKPTVAPAPAPVEEKVSHRSGAVTIQELTEKCKQIAQSKDDEIVNKPHVSDDEEEEEHLFINHPFKVNEPKSISFSLSNPTIKPAPKNQVTLTKEFPVSSGSQHRKKEVDAVYGEWVPVEKSSEESKDDVFTTTLPPPSVDISAAMTKRAAAQKRLTGNPFDMVALCLLNRAQEQIDAWAQSSSLPGQFTGSTGAQVLSSEELTNSGPQAWIRKDQFLKAAPVTGGMGAQLMRKMGWKEGEGLGRNNEGTVEPILIDFKRDRKGLVAEGEKTQKKSGNLTVMKDLSGKHPISALMEICNKRKWSPPEFVLVHDRGPDHRRHFLFKVMVNGSEYQPSLASPNKKLARATTATVALQAMGLVPRDNIANATSFMSASDS
ncbi:protein SON isoform X2 [Rhinatrema bivittatum]|uniref:protein SON isoform X2 n=1 Tax=Rhinatrema bivittatum TaxID=194408 RepID=UPI00112AD54A|nr:protein SON isoform X2 [Rhinatrema bivittatum]